MRFFVTALLVSLAVLTSQFARADDQNTAKASFRAGVLAFQNGNLDDARRHLESAEALGLSSRSLHYNLGVLYYRLGLLADAEQRFRLLLDTPQHTLALYNLGLIALAQGDDDNARGQFQQVVRRADHDKLTRLAQAQLDRLGTERSGADWQGLLTLATGYGENVGVYPDDARSDLDDNFIQSNGALRFGSDLSANDRLSINLQTYLREYRSEDRFNTHLLRLDTEWAHKRSQNVWLSVSAGADQSWFGNQPRERTFRLATAAETRGCAIGPERARCRLALTSEWIEASAPYRAYDGQRHRLEGRYRARVGAWSGELRLRSDYHDRRDFQSSDDFISVSPWHQSARLRVGYRWSPVWTISGSGELRYSYYRDANRISNDDTLLVGHREDWRTNTTVDLEARLNSSVALSANGTWVSNRSNFDRYTYDTLTASVGLNLYW